MRVIILNAGSSTRLYPLTKDIPKCLLKIGNRTILEHQFRNIISCNQHFQQECRLDCLIEEIIVIIGYQAEKMEKALEKITQKLNLTQKGIHVCNVYDPFYDIYDNLESLWLARWKMDTAFVTIDGDNLFDYRILTKLIDSNYGICIPSFKKEDYDIDDMKIRVAGTCINEIGKDIPLEKADADTVGMIKISEQYANVFRNSLDEMIRFKENLRVNYWNVIKKLISNGVNINHIDVNGLFWMEIDTESDLREARGK